MEDEPRVEELSSSEEEPEPVVFTEPTPEPSTSATPESTATIADTKDESSSETEESRTEQKEEDEEDKMDPEELAELVAKAEKFKEQGNTHFSQKDYIEATYYYTNGIDILPKKNKLTAILYSNRAACFFAQEEWQKTVDDATKALEIDPNYTKALFRRATAYEHLKDYVKALEDFKKYVELDPNPHPSAKRAVKHLPPLAQKQEEEERAKMMEDLKGLGNKFLGLFGMSIDNFEAKQDPATGSYSIQFNPNAGKK